jgi:hypothetical protein
MLFTMFSPYLLVIPVACLLIFFYVFVKYCRALKDCGFPPIHTKELPYLLQSHIHAHQNLHTLQMVESHNFT